MAPARVIIDTDPGVDDVLAMLLALSAKPEELEVLLISVTYGNVEVESCLRNVVSLFHVIQKEREWRKQNGRPEGFETITACKPIVAVGADRPLSDQMMMADYFHGRDGLGGISSTHPHLTPAETWKHLFDKSNVGSSPVDLAAAEAVKNSHSLFTASKEPAHLEILRLLRENEPDTISIVAIGPLTNCAIAAATDPETFLRAKELVVMGGTLDWPGNITPVAEFNTYADSIAAARVFALTSPNPSSTLPPIPPTPAGQEDRVSHLQPYPKDLGGKRLKLTLVPLDITSVHTLSKEHFFDVAQKHQAAGSPLAEWANAFLTSTFKKMEMLHSGTVSLAMHDPLCIYYLLTPTHEPRWQISKPADIRVETSGQWTRGMMVVDKRDRFMNEEEEPTIVDPYHDPPKDVVGDSGNWLSKKLGNRVRWLVKSPGEERFSQELLQRLFG